VHFLTMHQRVVDELGRRIVGGAWEPGDPLPVEDALAAEIGVSRGLLREAVEALVAKEMLHVRPRTGTRVLPPEHWNHLDRDVLRWKRAGDATALLRDTGELRRIVEPEAARLAADRAGPDDVRVMYEALAAMEAAAADPGRGGYVEADMAFHRALLDAGGNRLLGSLGRAVDIALEHSLLLSTQTPVRWKPRCRVTAPSWKPSRPATPRRRPPYWPSSKPPNKRSPSHPDCRAMLYDLSRLRPCSPTGKSTEAVDANGISHRRWARADRA
jgi:DNA-binding FadR family transcriptional regulator